MTFTIIGLDKKRKEIGIATRTKLVAGGADISAAKFPLGAVATQAAMNVSYKEEALELLKTLEPKKVIERLVKHDLHKQFRQVMVMNFEGQSSAYTGVKNDDWAGHISGNHYICAGNTLTSEKVLTAMAHTFESSKGRFLVSRLMSSLEAGEIAGGDWRNIRIGSTALLVVKDKHGLFGVGDRYIDLRIDMSTNPIRDLKKLLKIRLKDDSVYRHSRTLSPY